MRKEILLYFGENRLPLGSFIAHPRPEMQAFQNHLSRVPQFVQQGFPEEASARGRAEEE